MRDLCFYIFHLHGLSVKHFKEIASKNIDLISDASKRFRSILKRLFQSLGGVIRLQIEISDDVDE